MIPLASTRATMMSAANAQPPTCTGRARVSATAATDVTTPTWSRLTNGTFRRVRASSAQSRAMTFPNIGAAVMTASSTGDALKYLAATTPVNDPSASAAASGYVSADRSSWR